MALLTALVERPGEIVTKQELFARAWPDTFVEEGNLKVNMASLRRALQDHPGAARYVATVVGRGYRFIASVQRSGSTGPVAELPASSSPPSDIAGKTMAALAIVKRLIAAGNGGVRLIDLSLMRDPDAVPLVIAAASGLQSDPASPVDAVRDHPKDPDILLLLDGRDFSTDAVARTVDRLLVDSPDLKILYAMVTE
jgi:DNA-binding winged helix-turn-helix (wHTH) protein